MKGIVPFVILSSLMLIVLLHGYYGRAQSTTFIGDINGDGEVNLKDLTLLALAYQSVPSSPNWNIHADLDGNGIIDQKDVQILISHYGEGLPIIMDVRTNLQYGWLVPENKIVNITVLTIHADKCILSYCNDSNSTYVENGQIWTNETMTGKDNVFTGFIDTHSIPFDLGGTPGRIVHYKITATDNYGNINTTAIFWFDNKVTD